MPSPARHHGPASLWSQTSQMEHTQWEAIGPLPPNTLPESGLWFCIVSLHLLLEESLGGRLFFLPMPAACLLVH